MKILSSKNIVLPDSGISVPCRFTRIVIVALIVIGGLIVDIPSVSATGQSSARSMAMGGAYISLASGVDAARYNPANLGLSGYRVNGIELIGVGICVANNSLSLNDYNNYTGAILSQTDKNDILGKIPSEGLHLIADVEASALSISLGSFVFSATGVGVADFNLNKDILDLVLNGNRLGQDISLTGSYSDAVAFVKTGLSYGRSVYTCGTRQLAVGATFKHLRGLALERIVELDGEMSTETSGFKGAGRIIARTAGGGGGYGLDIGTALRLDDSYTVGLSFRNILSFINWDNNTREHGYLFSFDTVTIDNMEEDYIVSEDYEQDIDAFTTNLPSVMTIGVANTSGALLWAVDWKQGFRRAAGASSEAHISAGMEWSLLRLLPLRAGLATGGAKGTRFSVGSGVNLSAFQLDLAMESGFSLKPVTTKNLNFAISLRVNL
ncbi:MAG: DUF5723 family protein [candidate division Zixibacteria bacterium]|nr:DUF5723 family protein [candidate division Zixibacteria bacterium]